MAIGGGRTGARSVLSATRLHFPPGTEQLPEATVQHLRAYAINVLELKLAAAVAVNCLYEEVEQIMKEAAPGVDVTVLHVPVWGAFVPALNTLLGEAQRREFRYIMYQSLEVKCSAPVLKKMLDHHTADTLVVGPVLDGHVFQEGIQPLHGRSCPWNTLALWSTRKLALTGFLSIADGLPKAARKHTLLRQMTGKDNADEVDGVGRREESSAVPWGPDRQRTEDLRSSDEYTMGSDNWWGLGARQPSEAAAREVPAGVEEVTAVALLQHLLGDDRARAILVQLPPELVEWKANWNGDERRRQWHEYKMASKVARPAAQIQQLFKRSKAWHAPSSMLKSLLPSPASCGDPESQMAPPGRAAPGAAQEEPGSELNFGVVMHLGQSIRPPPSVEWLCLLCFALFTANFTAYFASAFRAINAGGSGAGEVLWISLSLGGVYFPMPLSLFLTRKVVFHLDHRAGLALFAGTLLLSNLCVAWAQASGWHSAYSKLFLAVRLWQGMGAGVLFQARFILSSLSTHDHHVNLQARSFVATDLGLGLGAILPWAVCSLAGYQELPASSPALLTALALAALSLALLLGIVLLFPRRLHRLPSRVRFPDAASASKETSQECPNFPRKNSGDAQRAKAALLVSGTTRVFVQSAAIVTLALWMRDVGLEGHFAQTMGTAALGVLPLPFFVLATRGAFNASEDRWHWSRTAAIATLMVVVVLICTTNEATPSSLQLSGLGLLRSLLVALELLALLVALAIAAPLHVSLLYQLGDAEQSMVTLEWLKAYVGRLLGPAAALVLQGWLGYRPVLLVLCALTSFVAVTA